MKKNKLSKFMTTPLGGLLKHFVFIVLTQYLIELESGHNLFTLDNAMVNKLLTAGIVSCLPVILNWINPNYKNYGK